MILEATGDVKKEHGRSRSQGPFILLFRIPKKGLGRACTPVSDTPRGIGHETLSGAGYGRRRLRKRDSVLDFSLPLLIGFSLGLGLYSGGNGFWGRAHHQSFLSFVFLPAGVLLCSCNLPYIFPFHHSLHHIPLPFDTEPCLLLATFVCHFLSIGVTVSWVCCFRNWVGWLQGTAVYVRMRADYWAGRRIPSVPLIPRCHGCDWGFELRVCLFVCAGYAEKLASYVLASARAGVAARRRRPLLCLPSIYLPVSARRADMYPR